MEHRAIEQKVLEEISYLGKNYEKKECFHQLHFLARKYSSICICEEFEQKRIFWIGKVYFVLTEK